MPIQAEPYAYDFAPAQAALLIIDMQRDFLEPGGFGEALGNDVSRLRRAAAPAARPLACRRADGHPYPRGPPPDCPLTCRRASAVAAAAPSPSATALDGPHPRARRTGYDIIAE